MSKIFVTSDIWFNRPVDNLLEYTTNEYNDVIVNNWNKVVGKKDTVFILGGLGISDMYHLIVKLNGQIHILNNFYNQDEIEFVNILHNLINTSSDKSLSKKIIFYEEQILPIPELDVILSYFPLESWCGHETGTFCFHGYNSNSDFSKNKISCKSSVWENKPILIEDVKNNLQKFKQKI